MLLQMDSEDFDQTVWMTMLIRVFAGRTDHFVSFVVLRLIYNENVAIIYTFCEDINE